ncbi:hypothetical protein [Streptomyces chryseus]|uniref:hypothetical protein n=1 Tax=Streptomyces chryseus TaxID=68186 RepID=UPI0019BA9A57|nr:hypothetical protein [Streptomyces chryseus]GGX26961.1 hypothetical protein GCM10010353_47720 [Streptomyces chryseus]
MAYRSTYHGKFTGMGAMLRRPWMLRAVTKPAHRALAIAQALSPTGNPAEDPHPGLYRSAFKVTYELKNKPFRGQPALRATATLVNTAPHAGIVEYGNGKTEKYAVLRRTIDAMKAAHGGS